MTMSEDTQISAVSETLFLPLYSLALESQRPDPIMVDAGAVELTRQLNTYFEHSDKRLFRRLAKGKLPGALLTSMSLRIRQYDRDVAEFLAREPDGIVVNLGCGLNDRRRRCDNGRARWFDLDLPEVIALRRRFLSETDRMHFIAASVLDFAWLDALPSEPGHKFLFVAEGLFMYLPPDDVRALVVTLRERFPGSELIAEVASTFAVRMLNSRVRARQVQAPVQPLRERGVRLRVSTTRARWRRGRRASSCSASGRTSTTTSPSWAGTGGSRSGRCCARFSTRCATGWAPPSSPPRAYALGGRQHLDVARVGRRARARLGEDDCADDDRARDQLHGAHLLAEQQPAREHRDRGDDVDREGCSAGRELRERRVVEPERAQRHEDPEVGDAGPSGRRAASQVLGPEESAIGRKKIVPMIACIHVRNHAS